MRFSLKNALTATLCIAVFAWAATSSVHFYDLYGATASITLPILAAMAFLLGLPFTKYRRFRQAWTVAWLVALIAFSWRVNFLHHRLSQLRSEVARIVAYLERHIEREGDYPRNLAKYRYERPELAEYIQYDANSKDGGYSLTFHPRSHGSLGIYHEYTPEGGYWFQDD